jgi:uncharacterized SAM-binding protein YcdF (DUF218 family)
MDGAVALVKGALIPGSLPFLLLGLVIGLVLLYWEARSVRWSRAWLTLVALLYLVLSLPPVSSVLTSGLRGSLGSISQPADAPGARVVVVIGDGAVGYTAGGHALHQLTRRSAFAVLEAARVCRLLDPPWIVTSGGIPDPSTQQIPESDVMRTALISMGVPAERILAESRSRTTAEQITEVARLLTERGLDGPVVLVTTAAHAKRVVATARQQGLDAVPSIAADLDYGPDTPGWRRWVPAMDALHGSEAAMYEYIAYAYYRLSGRAG